MSRPSPRALVGTAAALAVLSTAAPAAAEPRESRGVTLTYALLGTDVFPEGVDTFGTSFYVTSTTDGTVFRGDLTRTSAEVFLPGGEDGRTTAIGIEATPHLLLIAGGATGRVFVYDRRSGEFLGSHSNGLTSGTFVNDIAVAPNGDVYATDSAADVVYRVPADEVGGEADLEVVARFTGLDPTGLFNANGIVSASSRYLVVVQSDTGALYRVSATDGAVRRIDLGGAAVMAGDGLELRGRTLFVVRNSAGIIAKVRLSALLTRGSVVDEITNPTFDFPTTAALAFGRLLVVNSQFDERGPEGNPEEPFTVSSIRP